MQAKSRFSHDFKGSDLRESILRALLIDLGLQGIGDPPKMVVAIPAKNEEDHIERCLAALAVQQGTDLATLGVVLLVNNSDDATAARAKALAAHLPYCLVVLETSLPGSLAHAGNARRLAMDLAAAWLCPKAPASSLIFTTDADSQVAPDWLRATRRAIALGADAVAGAVMLDPADEAALTPQLRERGRREAAYETVLIEIDSLLDPIGHDPWPRHDTASGASLAVTLEAYRGIGGLPPVPLGEDRALARALFLGGWRLRHDLDVRVVTSGRLVGRAAGGAADTIRRRNDDPAMSCDPRLEPLTSAIRRAQWRRRIRRIYEGSEDRPLPSLADALSIDPWRAAQAMRAPNFPRCWQKIEEASLLLRARCLTPGELPQQLLAGRAALLSLHAKGMLSQPGEARPDDSRSPALAAAPA